MSIVVLTEKSSQIDPYAKALGTPKKKQGSVWVHSALLNADVQFVAASGHLFKLDGPEYYNDAWRDRNNYEQLPMVPQKFKARIKDARARASFNRIKQAITAADEVILATDPDQQGEVIGREILQRIPGGMEKCQRRLLNSSLTAKGALRSFENLVPMAKQEHLGAAGFLQNRLNWLIGMNLSRVGGIQLKKRGYYFPVAAGTVKTPTLALVVANDQEIKHFKEAPYWQIELTDQANQQRFKAQPSRHFSIEDEAKQALAQVTDTLTIKSVNQVEQHRLPPKLFNLTALQGYAAKKWGYSGTEVLETMEHLYKDLAITSYPRTESTVIEDAEFDYLKANFNDYTATLNLKMAMQVPDARPEFVKTTTDGHPALIPTDKVADLSQLTERERRCYGAVVKRTLLMFAGDCVLDKTVVKGTAGTEQIYEATGQQFKDLGWTEFNVVKTENRELPSYQQGQQVKIEAALVEGKTKIPQRITEGVLFSKLFPQYNLGTPATRAGIVSELIEKNHYIEVKGKRRELYPTSDGINMVAFWQGTLLTDLKLAKSWQDIFDKVIQGNMQPDRYQEQMVEALTDIVADYRTKKPDLPIAPKQHTSYEFKPLTPAVKCPKCHRGELGLLVAKGEQNNQFYACSQKKCHFSLPNKYSGIALTSELVRQLATKKQTDWLPEVKSSQGKVYRNQVAFILSEKLKLKWTFKQIAKKTERTD